MDDCGDDDFNVSFGDEDFGLNGTTLVSTASLESCEAPFEIDDEDLAHSTPKKRKGTAQAKDDEDSAGTFKKPRPVRKEKPPPANFFARCTVCRRYLKTARGFNQHLQTHKWRGQFVCKYSI